MEEIPDNNQNIQPDLQTSKMNEKIKYIMNNCMQMNTFEESFITNLVHCIKKARDIKYFSMKTFYILFPFLIGKNEICIFKDCIIS